MEIVIEKMRSIYRRLTHASYERRKLKFSSDKRRKFLAALKNPASNIERSYLQFRCQMRETLWLWVVASAIISVLLLPMFTIAIVFKSKKSVRSDTVSVDALYFSDGIDSAIIPDSVVARYPSIKTVGYSGRYALSDKERLLLGCIFKKYWYSPYFLLKNAIKLSLYGYQIRHYQPEAIIVYSEYSFTSSILTELCRSYGIRHINVMHGEKLFNIRDAFADFDEFFVWDEFYKDLCIRMRMPEHQFVCEEPSSIYSLRFDTNCTSTINDFTYYLSGENKSTLLLIAESLGKIRDEGYSIKVRPHPRFSDISLIREVFRDYSIEDISVESIKQSIASCNAVIGINSTVLYQAHVMGKEIVLDNVTDIERFARLKDLEYILFGKPHRLLSDII